MFSGFTTRVEPAIPTPAGVRYPDLVAWKGDKCVVIDTTIVADNYDPDDAHDQNLVRRGLQSTGRQCPSVGLCAHMAWNSVHALRELRAFRVSKAKWGLMSVKTLEGGVECYAHFSKSTSGFGG